MARRDGIERRVNNALGPSFSRLLGKGAVVSASDLVPELVKAVRFLYDEILSLADELDDLEKSLGRSR